MADWRLRPARPEDAEACRAVTREGFATYRAFAGEDYRPPAESAEELAQRLREGWGVVAESPDGIVAFGAFEAAREGPRAGPLVPGLAHVWAVFVTSPHWGTGLAPAVLEALHAEMAGQGFTEARLYTPALQARARRFYAREGWTERGESFWVGELGLDLVELRRLL